MPKPALAAAAAIAIVWLSIASPSPAATPAWEAVLSGNSPGAKQLVIEGRLLGEDGKPMRNVRIHAYHVGADGRYTADATMKYVHEGTLRTNVLGEFRVRTGLPGMAEGGPHVHFDIELPGGKYRMIPLNLARKAGAGSDAAYGKIPWMVELTDFDHWAYVETADAKTYHCSWDLHVAKAVALAKPQGFEAR